MAWKWLSIRRRDALALLGLYVALGLWRGNTEWLEIAANGDDDKPWAHPYFWEMSGVLSAYVCTWLPFTAALNAPWRKPWGRFLAIHVVSFVLFAALHSSLMIGSRLLLYPLLGWGHYDYPGASFRLAMEGAKDVVVYSVLAATYVLLRAWRDGQQRALELRDAQLRVLVGQLNPHFLFNALNTISAVMYVDLAKTDRLIADLGEMLRVSLASAASPTWSLAEERAYTEHFVAVMLARFEGRLSVRWDVDGHGHDVQVPRFTLQLLVENAIKHNQDVPEPLAISISACRAPGRLEVEVADNGRGFATPTPSAGTGLATLRRALELCDATLELGRATTGGASVRVTVPA